MNTISFFTNVTLLSACCVLKVLHGIHLRFLTHPNRRPRVDDHSRRGADDHYSESVFPTQSLGRGVHPNVRSHSIHGAPSPTLPPKAVGPTCRVFLRVLLRSRRRRVQYRRRAPAVTANNIALCDTGRRGGGREKRATSN